MVADENKKAVLRCIELHNLKTLEWIDRCYSPDLEWIEMPRHHTPLGRRGGIDVFRRSAEQVLNRFPDRQLRVIRCIAENDCVVLEQEWKGTVGAAAGSPPSGAAARVMITSFFTLEKGLIVKQTDYCASVA
jgi:hypothetical protein